MSGVNTRGSSKESVASNTELEDIIVSCIERVLDRKLDILFRKIENSGKIHDIENKLDDHTNQMEQLQKKIDELNADCLHLQKETNDLEQYSRHN
ncbi:hypothetical protein HOLleu_31437 [Holothuria leucospilota]|uniref:Uncharacterized protein n=1 Tax=Holothuria leucospilota TaxID=206669 RepID=A0A9Q1BHS5_HOLLE|nr:hypothetical protein HOLleu_31437 [Holothuria leucospilota]